MIILIYILLLASLAAIGITIYNVGSSQTSVVRRRLAMLQKKNAGPAHAHSTLAAKKRGVFEQKIQESIDLFHKLGIEISVREVMLLNGISYIVVFLMMFLVSSNVFAAFLLGFIGVGVPYMVLSFIAQQRTKAFEKLFGDALYLMANTLKSGFSFRQALQIIATEMPSPICDEFELLNQEINWGLPVNEAMSNLAKRMPNDHVNLFVTAITIQSEVGGSLSEILGKIAEAIRTKDELRGEVKVLTAQGKASGLIVGLMPFLISMMVFFVNPSYIMKLFTTTIGLIMVGVALVMEAIGVFAIKVMVNIE